MTLFLDNDVPESIVPSLLHLGHEVIRVRDVMPADTPDDKVFTEAARRQLVLVTCNRDDFIPLASLQVHSGLIVLVRRRNRIGEAAALIRLIELAGDEGLAGNINFA